MVLKSVATAAVALLLAVGCVPPTVVGPGSTEGAATAERVASSLSESGISCEVTEKNYVHCNVDGNEVVLAVTIASTGRQLTLMVPYQQPACALPAYHARIARFNSDFILVAAGCVDEKTLILSHRTHLFRPGLAKQDLEDIVRKWFPVAVGVATEQGLLGPVSAEAEPEPKGKDKEVPSTGGKI